MRTRKRASVHLPPGLSLGKPPHQGGYLLPRMSTMV